MYCGLVLLAELVVKLVLSRSRTKGVLTAKTSENSRYVSGGGGCSSTQSTPPAYATDVYVVDHSYYVTHMRVTTGLPCATQKSIDL